MTLVRCPRCEAAAILNGHGALSRVARDDGAPVTVCNRCGEREALYGRDVEKHVGMVDWPVSILTLLAEEETLIGLFRNSELGYVRVDEIGGVS